MIARKRLQALVLNDEPSFRQLITAMMATMNWECEVVSNPEKALVRLKATQFDLLMTDYHLSHLSQGNGLHFISCLRREGITLPAIVMSEDGEALRTVPKEALNIPAVLLKPFQAFNLRVALGAVSVV
jgi:CheY-like chemotaxis protein